MKDWIIAILVSLLGVLLIGLAHVKMEKNNMLTTFNSFDDKVKPLEINHGYLAEVYNFHKSEPTFKRRIITSGSISALKKVTGWSEGICFILITSFSFFLCGFLLFFISKELGHNTANSMLSCLFFYSCYPY